MLKGYSIQYRFMLPSEIKHSSYTYQKLFRALYGYTQQVHKSNGKIYKYHRAGILSNMPYYRSAKNTVVIHPFFFQTIIEFFKTGKNPTHLWRQKGEWKAVYYMNEIQVNDNQAIGALEKVLDRKTTIINGISIGIKEEIRKAVESNDLEAQKTLFQVFRDIVNLDWFQQTYSTSPKLSEFYEYFKQMKSKQKTF